jgi:hypothetical protein
MHSHSFKLLAIDLFDNNAIVVLIPEQLSGNS